VASAVATPAPLHAEVAPNVDGRASGLAPVRQRIHTAYDDIRMRGATVSCSC
jgi:hypothetical protein